MEEEKVIDKTVKLSSQPLYLGLTKAIRGFSSTPWNHHP